MAGRRTPDSGRPRAVGSGVLVVCLLVVVALSLTGASTAAVNADSADGAAFAVPDPAPTAPIPSPSSLRLSPPAAGDSPAATPATPPAGSTAPDTTSREAPRERVPVVDATKPRRAQRAARPTEISVPRLDIRVPVVAVGVEKDQTMELPGTIRRAGWYRFGAAPSQRSGSTVIAAHVDTTDEGLGPFARLAGTRRGDRIVVTDADGDKTTYAVTTRRYVKQAKLPVDKLFTRNGRPRLVLITCGGTYDASTGYSDNLVVVAEPVR